MDKKIYGNTNAKSKHISVALFAHVDGGKTTLSEALLSYSGKIDKMGRVDHGDSFFDTFNQERDRGITIFSKQAELNFKKENIHMTLLDTPGHVDFAAETERIMNVLDYAIVIINGREGVQSYTKTLWELLDKYRVPRFVFLNKMDIAIDSKEELMANLKKKLYEGCIDYKALRENAFANGKVNGWGENEDSNFVIKEFANSYVDNDQLAEELSFCHESLMEEYLEDGKISIESIKEGIKKCRICPCVYGAALKSQGVEELLECVALLAENRGYPDKFGAKVYKISKDSKGNRLTFMKMTGGSLKIRDVLETGMVEEKVNEIRRYSGENFENLSECKGGDFVCIPGLKYTYAGQGLGKAKEKKESYMKPLVRYEVVCPSNVNKGEFIEKLKEVQELLPELNLAYSKELSEISVGIMGKIQLEVLSQLILDRYGFQVTFRRGKVIYQETVTGSSVGIGHFEPLRHYAEAVLLMEPGERGSGITFETNVSEDIFDLNFQRLIETHVYEKDHKGVLIGAPITDVKFTLIFGKWHKKHTIGGDFREATYRAIRNGLLKNQCALLEPYYEFILEIPQDNVGRAMSDLGNLSAKFTEPIIEDGVARIEGTAPAVTMMDYSENIAKYTGGKGNIILKNGGYDLCHNQNEVVAEAMYDPEFDSYNTGDSVFCSHGSGVLVPWYEVDRYMSTEGAVVLKNFYKKRAKDMALSMGDTAYPDYDTAADFYMDGFDDDYEDFSASNGVTGGKTSRVGAFSTGGTDANHPSDAELDRIFERTYGKKKDRTYVHKQIIRPRAEKVVIEKQVVKDSFIIVDGYNIIFAWDELKALAQKNMDSARDSLLEILANYQGFTGCKMVVVFDAYKRKGNVRKNEKIGDIDVVYTGEDETADSYIERLTGQIGKDYYVQVATSDNLEQQVILGHGAHRISALGFREEVKRIDGVINDVVAKYNRQSAQNTKTTVGDKLEKAKANGKSSNKAKVSSRPRPNNGTKSNNRTKSNNKGKK